jgi:hypothetical protein
MSKPYRGRVGRGLKGVSMPAVINQNLVPSLAEGIATKEDVSK